MNPPMTRREVVEAYDECLISYQDATAELVRTGLLNEQGAQQILGKPKTYAQLVAQLRHKHTVGEITYDEAVKRLVTVNKLTEAGAAGMLGSAQEVDRHSTSASANDVANDYRNNKFTFYQACEVLIDKANVSPEVASRMLRARLGGGVHLSILEMNRLENMAVDRAAKEREDWKRERYSDKGLDIRPRPGWPIDQRIDEDTKAQIHTAIQNPTVRRILRQFADPDGQIHLKKIQCIKEIRAFLAWGLLESKWLAEAAPMLMDLKPPKEGPSFKSLVREIKTHTVKLMALSHERGMARATGNGRLDSEIIADIKVARDRVDALFAELEGL